jgi:hypothetical protein
MRAVAVAFALVGGLAGAQNSTTLPVKVHLRLIDEKTVEITVANQSDGVFDAGISSSLSLGHSEREAFWAPFDPSTGLPYDMSVVVCPGKPIPLEPKPPRLKLAPRESRRLTIRLHDLKWAKQISSVWPNQDMGAIVSPGRYPLVWELAAYGDDAHGVKSAPVTLDIVRK